MHREFHSFSEMLVNCDICRIVLSEHDVESHNRGKKHFRNLAKFKVELTPNTRAIASTSVGNDESKTEINEGKESLLGNNETGPSDSKSAAEEKEPSSGKEEGTEPTKKNIEKSGNLVIIPSKTVNGLENAKVPSPGSSLKPPEAQKQTQRMQKRKLKDDSPKPLSVPHINNLVSFNEQVFNFIRQIEQTQNEWVKINWVLNDVKFTFGHVIPDVTPVLYGSSFSGLAFKTSDIDIYLYDPRGGEPDRQFIQRDGSIIYRFRLFTNVIRIHNARVPVIKATHVGTGIDLDISATSGQAVANSHLLRFLLSHDWRIRSLMMLLGYLGKKYTLIGVNKFSRYSINLLIIFYLQNLDSPILPPLFQIVYSSPGRIWPSAFNDNLYILLNKNKQSLAELFMGFFEFYLNFPFANFVISTYLGGKVTHEEMEKEETLDKMFHYKNFIQNGGQKIVYRCICVQDPLELSHNTTKGVSEKVLHQFKFICTNALQIKQTSHDRDWLIEMLKMNYIPPLPNRSFGAPISFNVKYSYSGDDWISSIKHALEVVFSALGMDIDWNYPIAEDDTKKTKLSPGLSFAIETRKVILIKGLKWSLNQLKLGNYNLKDFLKALQEVSKTMRERVFSAHCFVSLDRPNVLRVTFKSICTNKPFFKLLPILEKNFETLLSHASEN